MTAAARIPPLSRPSARPALGRRPAAAPEARQPGRSLVPVTGASAVVNESAGAPRPEAAFLAQLIATRMQAPQTRARRRCEPETASALYSAMAAATATGPKLRTSL